MYVSLSVSNYIKHMLKHREQGLSCDDPTPALACRGGRRGRQGSFAGRRGSIFRERFAAHRIAQTPQDTNLPPAIANSMQSGDSWHLTPHRRLSSIACSSACVISEVAGFADVLSFLPIHDQLTWNGGRRRIGREEDDVPLGHPHPRERVVLVLHLAQRRPAVPLRVLAAMFS